MIIRRLKLENFGIYGGEPYTFDLRPAPSHHFNRPIVLISGKNGVGKTTFVEAIRLCLHGPLALGSRVAQKTYEAHLRNRIHRPLNGRQKPDRACIELEFDYVSEGQKRSYRVVRAWRRLRSSIQEELFIWEDEQLLADLQPDQREEFLRELVPPGVADLFFFDGEKIRTLAEDDQGNLLLADTVKALLGLNMVEQLGQDLDIFISRQQANDRTDALQEEVQTLRAQIAEFAKQRSDVEAQQQELIEDISQLNDLIEHQEQQIAVEGGWFSKQREEVQSKLRQLEADIEATRRQGQEMSNELLPFAIVPEMLRAVADRLEKEKQYQEWQSNEKLLLSQLKMLRTQMSRDSDFWEAFWEEPEKEVKDALFAKIQQALGASLPQDPVDEAEVFLHASDKDRHTMLYWIEEAQDAIPRRFCTLAHTLDQLEQERHYLLAELEKVPADETLKPLAERLNELYQQLGAREQEREKLEEEIQRLNYHLEQTESQLSKVHERLAAQEDSGEQVRMAARTQLVLEKYEARLAQAKVELLEQALVKRFNQLCSKEQFIDAARIDSDHFTVTLYRAGDAFARTELSAGERQLLAIATMWALREVSDRPTPVIIDTPLSRLDSVHRLRMVENYFPRVSHQVIILATDAEIDQQLQKQLAPAISHVYQMEYVPETGTTKAELKSNHFSSNGNGLIQLDRISAQ